MAENTPTQNSDLEAQAREWIAQRDRTGDSIKHLGESHGIIASPDPRKVSPSYLPEPLQSKVRELLELEPEPICFSALGRLKAVNLELAKQKMY